MDRENPTEGHNALHNDSNKRKRPSRGPKQTKAAPSLAPPISTF